MDRRARRRRMAVVAALLVLAPGCLLAEVLARVVVPENRFSAPMYQPDPDTGFRLAPGEKGRGVVINAQGLRDVERPVEKPPGKRRVLVLGDSFAFGATALEDGFPRRLEGLLGPDVEVVNGGVPAWSTAQQAAWLKKDGLRYGPDAVVLAFFVGNDVWENTEWATAGAQADLVVEDGRLVERAEARETTRSYWRELRNRSALYRIVKQVPEQVRARLAGEAPGTRRYHKIEQGRLALCARDPEVQRSWEPGWRLTAEKLAEVRDLARPAPVVVLLIPDEFQASRALLDAVCARYGLDPAAYDVDRPQRRLTELCAGLGLEVVDVLPELRRRTEAGEVLYIPLDSHWNPQGNRLAAEALAASATLGPFRRRAP